MKLFSMIALSLSLMTSYGRGVSNSWTAPVQNRHHCEFCERLEKAGRILKGANLVEWRRIKSNHERNCVFARNRIKKSR